MKFIDDLKIEKIHTRDFDSKIAATDQLVGVFFWGENCPNCEIAKNTLSERQLELTTWEIKWFHANIYEDFDLANRFGLFGIPVFMFFKSSKRLGKISPFPGFEPFSEAVQKLLAQYK